MSHPYPVFGTENLKDDDAAVIDELFTEQNAPAPLDGAVEPVLIPRRPEPKPSTRIITNTITFPAAPGGSVTPLLNEDLDRVDCYVRVTSFAATPAAATDYVLLADEPGKISGKSKMGGTVARSGNNVDFSDHTGPLYVVDSGVLTGVIEVTVYAITEMPER